jgi:ABC-type uncharacterized transport system permease subunit
MNLAILLAGALAGLGGAAALQAWTARHIRNLAQDGLHWPAAEGDVPPRPTMEG